MDLRTLQKVLGSRIDLLANTEYMSSLDSVAHKRELDTAHAIASLSKQMINNADVILRTDKLISDGKISDSNIEKLVNGDA